MPIAAARTGVRTRSASDTTATALTPATKGASARASAPPSGTIHPDDVPGASVTRVSGAGKTGISVAVAKKGWTKSTYVVVADVAALTDQCTAAPLAGAYSAPLLLSEGGRLTLAAAAEVKRLRATKAFIVGGSAGAEARTILALKKAGVKSITRFRGSSAADTAQRVARQIRAKKKVLRGVIIANDKYPAWAAGAMPMAGRLGLPVLFTSAKSAPTVTTSFLKAYKPTEILVAGSPGIVPTSTINVLAGAAGITGDRLLRVAGADALETAGLFAELAFAQGLSYRTLVMPSADRPTDLYVAGALGARRGGAIALTRRSTMPATTGAFVEKHRSSIRDVIYLGDARVIPASQASALTAATRTLVQPNAYVVQASLNSLLTSISPDSTRIYFKPGTDLSSIQTSDVLVSAPTAGAPNGYLVEVVRVLGADAVGTVVVEVRPASLLQVFRQVSVDVLVDGTKSASTQAGRQGAAYAETVGDVDQPLYHEFYNDGSTRVWTDGTFHASLKLIFNLSIRWVAIVPVMHSFEFSVQSVESLDLRVNLTTRYSAGLQINFARVALGQPLVLWFNGFPVVIFLSAQPFVTGRIDGNAAASVGVKQNVSAQAGFRYTESSGWKPVSGTVPGEPAPSFDVIPPTASNDVSVRLGAGVTFYAMLYGVTGLSAAPEAYLRVATNSNDWRSPQWFKVFAGVDCIWRLELVQFLNLNIRFSIGNTPILKERLIYPDGRDRTPPHTAFTVPPPNGVNGWYVRPVGVQLKSDEPGLTYVSHTGPGGPWLHRSGPMGLGVL